MNSDLNSDMDSDMNSDMAGKISDGEGAEICLACGREFRSERPEQRLCPMGECGVNEKERQRVIHRATGRCLDCGWSLGSGHHGNCR